MCFLLSFDAAASAVVRQGGDVAAARRNNGSWQRLDLECYSHRVRRCIGSLSVSVFWILRKPTDIAQRRVKSFVYDYRDASLGWLWSVKGQTEYFMKTNLFEAAVQFKSSQRDI